ncbi:monocarboxylate transporter 12-like [Pomacea canaliculata]|uniref:monocarboxylate transporter 12-like n=1 Tax=Pomacea canaliculata TaxID=400727 RepID=UPI000D732ECA|nr:monocarboxylate transporter 12-like [Pomacea canaliculata]XP_025079965.1 monocarboxylate transporter 12-like [Pomacea canaliculata]
MAPDTNRKSLDEQEHGEGERHSGDDVDSGWAWVVLVSVFCLMALMAGFENTQGLVFVEIEEKFRVSALVTSIIGGAYFIAVSISVIFVMMFVLEMMSVRQCMLIGVALYTSGVGVSSVVRSYPGLVVTLGVITGVGASFLYGPSFVLLGRYFDRRLSLATAVANTGVSVGSIVIPFVMRLLLDQFSLSGGLLVMSAVLANMFVCACLLRPFPASHRDAHSTCHLSASKDDMVSDPLSENTSEKLLHTENELSSTPEKHCLGELSPLTVAQKPGTSSPLSCDDNVVQLGDRDSILFYPHEGVSTVCGPCDKKTRVWLSAARRRLAQTFDISVFRRLAFWVLVFHQWFGIPAASLALVYLPPLALEKGFSEREATFMVMVTGGCDIFSRILPGVIANFKLLQPHEMVIASQMILGILFQFTSLFNTLPAMVAFSAVLGTFGGVFFSMRQMMIIDFVGLQRFPMVFGFIQLFNAISLAVGFLIVGYMKDTTGSCIMSFHYLGATQIVSCGIFLSFPLLSRCWQRCGREAEGVV